MFPYIFIHQYKILISNKLMDRFLWVEFQLKAIYEQVSDLGIEETLSDIPQDIHATYERILDMIDKKPRVQRELAKKALLFIAYAREPVSIDVLAIAIAAKDYTQTLDGLRSSVSIETKIFHACGNLLAIDSTGPDIRQRVCFVHFSVHEFLTSQQSKLLYALSLDKAGAHREIARMCMVFLLIFYSHIQDFCTDNEGDYIYDYILPALPFHLLEGKLDSLPPGDEVINLTSLFFKRCPPLLLSDRFGGPSNWKTFCTFSPSVLALLFNLPGTYQCYDPQVLYGEQLSQKVITWVYGRTKDFSIRFIRISDDRLAIHYATRRLDSVPACQRLCSHGYPIEYSYHYSDGPLNTFSHDREENLELGNWNLTPLYLVRSEEVARFLIDRGASVNPQAVNHRLPNLLGHLAFHGNEKVIQLLLDRGAEQEEEALSSALNELAWCDNVEAIQVLLDNGINVSTQGGVLGSALETAATHGNVRAMRILLDNGADVNAKSTMHVGNALQAAVESNNVEAVQLLLDKGAEVHAQCGYYGNALQVAALNGNVGVIRLLVNEGADVNVQGGKYGNPLQAAAHGGNLGAMQFLLDQGANVNVQGGPFGNPLQAGACSKNVEGVQLLLDRGANVHTQGGEHGNALRAAAHCGKIEAIKLLLDKGADVNADEECGNALYAAACRRKVEVVSLLLDHGADVNAHGEKYGNALCGAAGYGNVEVVRLLLDQGADVNAQGGKYGNALCGAACYGNVELVQLLLDQGADVNAQSGKYGNALQAAAAAAHEHRWDRAHMADFDADGVIQLLLDQGANVYAQGGLYGNALQAAAKVADDSGKTVQLLLDKGADVHAQGGRFGNALQAAAYNCNIEAMRLLLDNGADANAQGGKFETALLAAAACKRYRGDNHTEAVRLLLGQGADAHAQGGQFGNALQAAAFHGRTETIQLLLDNGADVNARGGEYGNALQAATCNGKVDAVWLLLRQGVDINAQGGVYGTALQGTLAAGGQGDLDYLFPQVLHLSEILLDHGADVTAYVPGSKYGDAVSAAKDVWKDHKANLKRLMRLFESRGWKEGGLGATENGSQSVSICTETVETQ